MKLVYSWQALADLDAIAIYYVAHATPAVAEAIGLRLHEVTERIRRVPEAAPRVSQRSHIGVVAVVRYPFRIFYRVRDDAIDILHVRHTSRRPPSGFSADSREISSENLTSNLKHPSPPFDEEG